MHLLVKSSFTTRNQSQKPVNIIDTLTELKDASDPFSGAHAAYAHAISLIESIENLNVLHWKLTQAEDAADSNLAYTPEYRHSYLQAIENAHRIVLELRIDDE